MSEREFNQREQIRRQAATIHDLRQDLALARSQLEALRGAARILPPSYAEALLLLEEVAYGARARPDAARVASAGSESQPPIYNPRAFQALQRERRDLAIRAGTLAKLARKHAGDPDPAPRAASRRLQPPIDGISSR